MASPPVRGCDIRVYSGGAPQRVLAALLPGFERATGHKVVATFEIVSKVLERVTAGDHPDLILLPEQVLAEARKAVSFTGDGAHALAKVGIAAIVAKGAKHPSLSNETDVRAALQQARAVVVADPRTPTGRHLEAMLMRLGLAEELRGRLIHKGAIHGGGDLVAAGEADLGLFLVSEVQHIEGVHVVGLLPPALQQHVVYAAAIPQSACAPDAASSLIAFLKAPANALPWRDAGFELVEFP